MALNIDGNKDLIRDIKQIFIVGAGVSFALGLIIQAVNAWGGGRGDSPDDTFYLSQPIGIGLGLSSLVLVGCFMWLYTNWTPNPKPYKPPVFSYRVTRDDENGHVVYLLANGKTVNYPKWAELSSARELRTYSHDPDQYVRKNFKTALDAAQAGMEMVQKAEKIFGALEVEVLIEDSAKIK